MAQHPIPATHRDLPDSEVATPAMVGPGWLLQLSEVWFLADDDEVGIALSTARQKTKNLRADPAWYPTTTTSSGPESARST